MRVEIRQATPDDAAQVAGILNAIVAERAFTVFDTPFSVEAEREFIARLHPRAIFHVAADPVERLVAFQVLEPFALYTHAFDHVGTLATFVDREFRGKGIAKQLFAATFAAAVAKGYEKISTFVRADNPAALETYGRQGFAIVGTARRHAKIDGRYIDEILIEKALTRSDQASSTAS